MNSSTTHYDTIIIGGSYAGLSVAMALGRSLRDVLIIDEGIPCNRQTPHSHNFITHDGEQPAVIAEKARAEISKYETIKFYHDFAIAGKKTEDGFVITTRSGEEFQSRKLVFATGIKDIMPDIKGFDQCWGITVVHCPYCHGYELRNKKTGLYANGERAFHLASLIKNLTGDLTILTPGKADFKPEQIAKLAKHNIPIIETGISAIEHSKGHINSVTLKDGTSIALEALYAALPFVQHSDIPASLGCEFNEQRYIKIDGFYKTTVPGVFACGDNSNMVRSVANAVASGNITGAMVNRELTEEKF